MVKRLPIFTTAALFVAMVLIGCESSGSSRTSSVSSGAADSGGYNSPAPVQPTGLLAKARPPVPDLPVPIGFDMVEDISRSYESAGARFIDHSFRGKARKFDVERFCRIQLPLKGWTFRGSQMVRGAFTMRYEKGNEFLEVHIWSEESWGSEKTTLQYNLQTLGRGEPKNSLGSYPSSTGR